MGLRDKIKETIEEFDWINDIDSEVGEETIDVLYNIPFYWYSPLSPNKWVSFQGMPKIFWLEGVIDSQEVKVCTHKHSKQDFYAKDCNQFFKSTVVKKFDRGVFVLQPQLTNINESKNDFNWIEDTNPKELESPYDFILEYFTKNTNNTYKGYEYGLDNFSGSVEWVPTKEGMLDFYIYATPFWVDGDNLPIDVVDADGNHESLVEIEMPKFKYEMELVDWLENEYPKIVYKQIENFSSEVLTEEMGRVCYKPRGYKNLEEFKKVIKKSAKKYKSPIEWKRGDKNIYEKAVSHYKNKCKEEGSVEFIESITSHFISGNIIHTKDDLEKIALSFKRKGQWREESKTKDSKYFGTYRQAYTRNGQLEKDGVYGWFESITKHMPNIVYDEKHVYEIYLYNKKTKKNVAVYVGLTCDLESRIKEHETGEGRYCKRESKSSVNDYLNENPSLEMRVVKKTKLPVEKEKAQSMEDKLIKKHDSQGVLEVLNKGATGVGTGSLGPSNKGRIYLSQIEGILKIMNSIVGLRLKSTWINILVINTVKKIFLKIS